jgi:hypothetical protein
MRLEREVSCIEKLHRCIRNVTIFAPKPLLLRQNPLALRPGKQHTEAD